MHKAWQSIGKDLRFWCRSGEYAWSTVEDRSAACSNRDCRWSVPPPERTRARFSESTAMEHEQCPAVTAFYVFGRYGYTVVRRLQRAYEASPLLEEFPHRHITTACDCNYNCNCGYSNAPLHQTDGALRCHMTSSGHSIGGRKIFLKFPDVSWMQESIAWSSAL